MSPPDAPRSIPGRSCRTHINHGVLLWDGLSGGCGVRGAEHIAAHAAEHVHEAMGSVDEFTVTPTANVYQH